MKSHRRLALAASVSALVLGATSACAVTGTDFRGGVAYEYDGEQVSLSEIDELVPAFCAGLASDPSVADAPLEALRAQIAFFSASRQIVDELEPGLSEDPQVVNGVDQQLAQIDFPDDLQDEARTFLTDLTIVNAYTNSTELAETILLEAVDQQVEFNPILSVGDIIPTLGSDDIAVALEADEESEADADLPASQRCTGLEL